MFCFHLQSRNDLTNPHFNELKFELTVKFIGLNPYPIPTSTQTKLRTFPRPFVVTILQFTSADEHPFDHHGGKITNYSLYLV